MCIYYLYNNCVNIEVLKEGVSMPAISTNIKIDADVKQQAQLLFNDLGMNLSTAINIFLRQAVREHSIPFHVGDPFYSKANQKYLNEVVAEIESGKAQLAEHELVED